MRKIEQQQQEMGFRINLGEYGRVLWRKKYFLVIPLLIALVVSEIGVRFLVPQYEASSLIRVGGVRGVDTPIEQYVDLTRRRDDELGQRLEADIMGNSFLDELIHRLGMNKDPQLIAAAEYQQKTLYPNATKEELVMRRLRHFLSKRITVHGEGPQMFRIAYSDANPDACYAIATAISRLYIELQKRETITALQGAATFSEEQLAAAKEKLDRSERALAGFQEQMAKDNMRVNPVTQGNITTAEKVRTGIDLTIRGAQASIERIRGPIKDHFGKVPDGTGIWTDPDLKKLVTDLGNRREAELLGELGGPGGATSSQADENGISSAQQAIQRQLGVLVATRFPDASIDYRPLLVEYFYQQAEIDALQQKKSRLDSYIAAFRNQVQTAPQMDTELTRLKQEVENNRANYNQFLNAQRTTQISEAAQNSSLGGNIVVVEAASRPLNPVRPNKVKILILAFIFGMAVGGAGLLVTEFVDSSFRSVEEVEKVLGLKVLGTVPRFDKTRWFHDSSRKRALAWTTTVVVLVGLAISAFYFYGKSTREQMLNIDLTNASLAPAPQDLPTSESTSTPTSTSTATTNPEPTKQQQ